MKDFPDLLLKETERFKDSTGKPLSARIEGYAEALNVIWSDPHAPEVATRFNRRLSKLLRGINGNPLSSCRLELRAEGVAPFDAKAEQDSRPALVLVEDDPQASFRHLSPALETDPTGDRAGVIVRGIMSVLLSYLTVQLFRSVMTLYFDSEADFPERAYLDMDHFMTQKGRVWCVGTSVAERFGVVRIVRQTAGLSVDNKTHVTDVCREFRVHHAPELIPKPVVERLTICELYHKVWPYLMGRQNLRLSTPEQQQIILSDTQSLASALCGLSGRRGSKTPEDRDLCERIERRLARAIGQKGNDEMGWEVYRILRSDKCRERFRSSRLFAELLQNDQERLAALNTIYQRKKREIHPADPQHDQAHEIMIAKYSPFFSSRLAHDPERDVILTTEDEGPVSLAER